MPNRAMRSGLASWISRESWTERIITFDPSWYLVCMGTGILVQLTALNFPYPASWLHTIGYIFWIVDVALFGLFTILSFTRLVLFPKAALSIFHDFQQTSFLGTVPIAWETIGTGVVVFYGSVKGAAVVAEVFFWIAVVLSFLVTCGSIYAMYHKQGGHKMNEVTGAWLLVFIPQIVAAAFGSGLANTLSVKNAFAVITMSYLMLSLGTGMSFLVLGIYLWRLMSCQLPARDLIVTTFVPVGPMGMSAYAWISLAVTLARNVSKSGFLFHEPWEPTPTDASRAAVVEMILWIGVMGALFLLGVGTFFLIEAIVSVTVRVPKSFNVGLWSFVFPVGVYANAWCKLGLELRNEGMKIYGIVWVVATAGLWVLCATSTTYKAVWQGKLFYAPGLQGWTEKEEFERLGKKSDESSAGVELDERNTSTTRNHDGNNEAVNRRQPRGDGTYASDV